MRIAVTGSSGLIGRALVASLTDDGHQVVPVVRSSSDAGPGAVTWDPAQGTIDAAGLEGIDGVVHLAGEPIAARRWTDEQKRRIRDSRAEGTRLLTEALAGLDHPPAVLVSGSAIGFYGDRGDEVLTEDAGPGDAFLSEVCLAWEGAAQPAIDAGIRTAFARTGIVLDTGDGALAKMLPLFRFGLGGRLGPGTQWWSWISLTDEVRALRFLLDHDVSGPVNLTGPAPATNAEVTRALGRALHRPTVLPVPRFGPKLLLGSELAEQLLFASARVQPQALTEAGFAFEHATVDEALDDLLGSKR